MNFQVVRCSPNLSTLLAFDLSSNHLWIFKLCVFCKIFPHSSQLTCHPIIRDFSNCALFAKSFHINCNIESFLNFQIVRFSPILSTFIAINLSSDHLWIIKLCVVRQIFPHSLQLCIVYFQMKRCSPNLYTFIASNLSFDYLWIFKVCVFAKSFHTHCN